MNDKDSSFEYLMFQCLEKDLEIARLEDKVGAEALSEPCLDNVKGYRQTMDGVICFTYMEYIEVEVSSSFGVCIETHSGERMLDAHEWRTLNELIGEALVNLEGDRCV